MRTKRWVRGASPSVGSGGRPRPRPKKTKKCVRTINPAPLCRHERDWLDFLAPRAHTALMTAYRKG
jgi:hypothetical protein